MSKSPADKIKEAAAGETDPKALSNAAETTPADGSHSQDGSVAKGDGKAPYKDDMASIYARLDALEKLVDDLGKQLISKQIKGAVTVAHSVEDRLDRIEKRLHGVVSE